MNDTLFPVNFDLSLHGPARDEAPGCSDSDGDTWLGKYRDIASNNNGNNNKIASLELPALPALEELGLNNSLLSSENQNSLRIAPLPSTTSTLAASSLLLPLPIDDDGDDDNDEVAASQTIRLELPPIQQDEREEEEEEEPWHGWTALALGPPSSDATTIDNIQFLTWERFTNPNTTRHEQVPALASEAGPDIYDAILKIRAEQSDGRLHAGRLVRGDAFTHALWLLSLGHGSLLFEYDKVKRGFRRVVKDARPSGFSLEAMDNWTKEVLDTGNTIVQLRHFVQDRFMAAHGGVDVALASAVSVLLEAIEEHSITSKDELGSLLQLRELVDCTRTLLVPLGELVDQVSTEQIQREAEKLDAVFRRVQAAEENGDAVYLVLRLVFTRMARPWLEGLLALTGVIGPITAAATQNENGGPTEGEEEDTQNGEEDEVLPDFVPKEDQELLQETRQCLRYIRLYHENSPLARMQSYQESKATDQLLPWCFSWEDVERTKTIAEEYYQTRSGQIAHSSSHSASTGPRLENTDQGAIRSTAISSWPSIDDADKLGASIDILDGIPGTQDNGQEQQQQKERPGDNDGLYVAASAHLRHCSNQEKRYEIDPFQPSLAMTPHLTLAPLLKAQTGLLARATLRSIVHEQQLRPHLEALHHFQLCGSGVFTSRLSAILFSPDMQAAERHKGVVRTTTSSGSSGTLGLRLGSAHRRAWPPASSELRLALMGLLSETWRPGAEATTTTMMATIPGDMSFALRTELDDDEMERILDPHSIYALDFLKLSYAPPGPLADLFTGAALATYDDIFRLMLRLLRVQFIVGQLFRGVVAAPDLSVLLLRYKHEATTFVTAVAAFFTQTAIQANWTAFQAYLDNLEASISFFSDNDDDDNDGFLAPAPAGQDAQTSNHATASDTSQREQQLQQQQQQQKKKKNKEGEYTLAALIKEHETVLARMRALLLLKKSQRKAKAALDGVFTDILTLAKILFVESEEEHEDGGSGGGGGEGRRKWSEEQLEKRVRDSYISFRTHIQSFQKETRTSGKKDGAVAHADANDVDVDDDDDIDSESDGDINEEEATAGIGIILEEAVSLFFSSSSPSFSSSSIMS